MISGAPTSTSTDSGAAFCQLLHVGAIRPQLASHLGPEALLCFKKLPSVNQLVDDAKLIRQPIPMQFATLFVPGSIGSADGKLVAERDDTASEHRTIVLEKQLPRPRRLVHLFHIGTAQPSALIGASPFTWCVALRNGSELIIIPCFELLRAFYYYSAGGLINYFFSRLALESLCWPINRPNENNDFTAHFAVASTSQRTQETRVLAELLFNCHYHRTIQLAHAELARAWHTRLTNGQAQESHVKVNFSLGRPISVQAYGTSFVVGLQTYFLVNQLIPPPDWYCFDKVVCHPLAKHPSELRHSPFRLPKLTFQEVLKAQRFTPTVVPVSDLPDTFRAFGRGNNTTLFKQAAQHPPVVKAFAWAERIIPPMPPTFAEADTNYFPWGRPGYSPPNEEPTLPYNLLIYSMLGDMRKLGCLTQLMEVNNFSQQFGIGRSLLPYSQEPTTTTHLRDYRQRPVSVASIIYGNAHFNIFNILDGYDVVLIYREDLVAWEDDDYERLLSTMMRAEFDWKYTEKLLTIDTGKKHLLISKDLKHLEDNTIKSVAHDFYKTMREFIRYYNFSTHMEFLKKKYKLNELNTFDYYFRYNEVYAEASKKKYSDNCIEDSNLNDNAAYLNS